MERAVRDRKFDVPGAHGQHAGEVDGVSNVRGSTHAVQSVRELMEGVQSSCEAKSVTKSVRTVAATMAIWRTAA